MMLRWLRRLTLRTVGLVVCRWPQLPGQQPTRLAVMGFLSKFLWSAGIARGFNRLPWAVLQHPIRAIRHAASTPT